MFTIKAVVHADASPEPFSLYTADRVHVGKSLMAQAPGPSPELEVDLIDKGGLHITTLYVGPGLDHFETVYVMNANGKTIQTVSFGGRAIAA